jgi:serine/threonine-protein kinase
MIGQTISHYKILEKLGEGGMGVVYRASDTKLKREVAIKFLTRNLGTEEDKKRFHREAQAAAALNHPNIATVYEIDESDGHTFIVMEYVEGRNLAEMLRAKGGSPLPLEDAINYSIQIAESLHAAHQQGVVHRDIKSANVMVTNEGRIKVMDFGLAKLATGTGLTKTGSTLGTAAYMSPEQAKGIKVDHRTDIWSLGVVMYEMITGQLPFKGDYDQAVTYAILNEDPEPITALRTGVPMALEGILNKAMAKDPKQRYQHVDEIPVDLGNIEMRPSGISRAMKAETMHSDKEQSIHLKRILPWGITVLVLIISIICFVLLSSKLSVKRPVNRAHIVLPESAPIAPIGSSPFGLGQPAFAISPDGTKLVYVADHGR